MFCIKCGSELPDNADFCPNCGNRVEVNSKGDIKEKLTKAAKTVSSSAKSVGEKINEATNGKAQAFAGKAKETALDFANDVKQTTNDKDSKGFFTKNKYRNTKLIVGLVIILIFLSSIFSSKDNQKGFREAEKQAYESVTLLSDVEKAKSSDIELVGYNPDTKGYVIIISVKAKTTYGSDGTLFYMAGIDKNGNVTSLKAAKSVIPSTKRGEKEVIAVLKDIMREEGFKLK